MKNAARKAHLHTRNTARALRSAAAAVRKEADAWFDVSLLGEVVRALGGSCFFVRDVRCGGPVFKAIPSAAVLGRPIPRFLVEPGVPVVRMRFDDAVFNPARDRGFVDPRRAASCFLVSIPRARQPIDART